MQKSVVYDMLKKAKSIFFVGIGGISMSSAARYAKKKGYKVGGSDKAESDAVRALKAEGIPVVIGHDGASVSGYDLIVFTSAVQNDNPEISAARSRGIPAVSRAQFIGAIMADYRVRIGVSGSHGKSTATAMISHMMLAAKKDPTVMCGAEISEIGGAYRIGEKEFLFEACEYRDSFLSFLPNIAVILNVDLDHTDYFSGIDSLISSFSKFAKISSDDGGSVIVCADDKNAAAAVKDEFPITFGIESESDYRAKNISEKNGFYSFSVERCDEPFIEKITLKVPGRHNIYNALAAIAVGDLLAVPTGVIAKALSDFSGISRRFERRGSVSGADVYIDYAHHPKEIASTIDAAKKMCRGKLITVFEPHTYSRTKALFDDFAKSFSGADVRIFTEIYAARETDTLGVSGEMLADAAKGVFAKSYTDAARIAKEAAQSGDMILILGAGSVNTVADIMGG